MEATNDARLERAKSWMRDRIEAGQQVTEDLRQVLEGLSRVVDLVDEHVDELSSIADTECFERAGELRDSIETEFEEIRRLVRSTLRLHLPLDPEAGRVLAHCEA